MAIVGMPAPPKSTFERNERTTSYYVDGVLRAPKTLRRIADTPDDLLRVIDEAMRVHRTSVEDIVSRTSLPPKIVADIVYHARGAAKDVLAVLDSLDVEAVSIPSLDALSHGVEHV